MIYTFYLLCAVMVFSYGFSSAWYYQVFFSEKSEKLSPARIFFVAGLGVHFLCLLFLSRFNHRYPFATGPEGLLFGCWLVALVHMGVEILSPRRGGLGFFTALPVTLVATLASFLVSPISQVPQDYRGALFSFHVVTSLAAYASFSIALILASLHLVLFKRLKNKVFDVFFKHLPPLDVLEKNSALWLLMGVVWMSLAGIIGHLWVVKQTQQTGMTPSEWLIFVLLFYFFFVLLCRRFFSFRGARFSYSVVLGYFYLLFLLIFSVHGF